MNSNKLTSEQTLQITRIAHLNQKAKELRFIEQMIEIAKGCRRTQPSLWRTLPNDMVIVIFLFVAGQNLRPRKQTAKTCLFLLGAIRASSKDKLNWDAAPHKSMFFKMWNKGELEDVRNRFPERAIISAESSAPSRAFTLIPSPPRGRGSF